MNLEVARLRAVPGADAGRVAPFAAAAAESHDEVVAMVRALTALAREPLTVGCDVRETVAHVVSLLAPGLRARGGSLALAAAGPARTPWDATRVRVAVTRVVLAATDATAGAAPALRLTVTRDAGAEGTRDAVWTLAFEPPVAPPLNVPSE